MVPRCAVLSEQLFLFLTQAISQLSPVFWKEVKTSVMAEVKSLGQSKGLSLYPLPHPSKEVFKKGHVFFVRDLCCFQ